MLLVLQIELAKVLENRFQAPYYYFLTLSRYVGRMDGHPMKKALRSQATPVFADNRILLERIIRPTIYQNYA